MPTYAYQAVDGAGKRTRGQAQATSSGALTRTLEQRGLFVLDVAESSEARERRRGFRFGRRREVLEVTRAMAALLPVGMPLAQALNAASGVASGDVRSALQEVRARVERGDTLSSALAEHRAIVLAALCGTRARRRKERRHRRGVRAPRRSARARRSSSAAKCSRRRSIRCCSRRPARSR